MADRHDLDLQLSVPKMERKETKVVIDLTGDDDVTAEAQAKKKIADRVRKNTQQADQDLDEKGIMDLDEKAIMDYLTDEESDEEEESDEDDSDDTTDTEELESAQEDELPANPPSRGMLTRRYTLGIYIRPTILSKAKTKTAAKIKKKQGST